MNEREKRQVGEQIEPGARPKAPGSLELLQRFVNTWNHDFPVEWDRLGTPEKARSWLVAKGLLSPEELVGPREVAWLRELREAIRELIAANERTAPDPQAVGIVRRASRKASLLVGVDDTGSTTLRAGRRGALGAVAVLLGILHDAQVTGDWVRMKACRRCGYAFYDRSKNRSAAWCAMSICGNRTKNRAYRRRRSSGKAPGSGELRERTRRARRGPGAAPQQPDRER